MKPVILTTNLVPLPQPLDCDLCQEPARWRKDSGHICSKCFIYSDGGPAEFDHWEVYVAAVESDKRTSYPRDPEGLLAGGEALDALLGAVVMTSRMFAQQDRILRHIRGEG